MREAHFVISDGAFTMPGHSVFSKWYYFSVYLSTLNTTLKEIIYKIVSLVF